MKNKKQLFKRMYAISSLLLLAALILTACSAFSFQGVAQPNSEGGITVSGGAQPAVETQPAVEPQPAAPAQPAASTGLSTTTIILIVVGAAFFILILVLMITRGQSRNEPPA